MSMTIAADTQAVSAAYAERRGKLQTYFDRTALDAWTQLTTDAPVSGIRATVRAGRDRTRGALLSWLPENLTGARLFDAGCGTGALAVAAAQRGARVIGVDVAANLIKVAQERAPLDLSPGAIDFRAGDMLDPRHGDHDYIVAMDSLIHYPAQEVLRVLEAFASRASEKILFTFAPRTPALSLMHAAGKLFPRGDRAPAIAPLAEAEIRRGVGASAKMAGWSIGRTERITSGFYVSQAMELVRR